MNDLLPELLVPPDNILVAAAGLLVQFFQAADFFAARASCGKRQEKTFLTFKLELPGHVCLEISQVLQCFR